MKDEDVENTKINHRLETGPAVLWRPFFDEAMNRAG